MRGVSGMLTVEPSTIFTARPWNSREGSARSSIDRPVRLVFSWDWEELASRVGDTLVSVEFREVGSNETKVIVTHERFADPTRMSRHEQGWTELLSLLERAVA